MFDTRLLINRIKNNLTAIKRSSSTSIYQIQSKYYNFITNCPINESLFRGITHAYYNDLQILQIERSIVQRNHRKKVKRDTTIMHAIIAVSFTRFVTRVLDRDRDPLIEACMFLLQAVLNWTSSSADVFFVSIRSFESKISVFQVNF